MFLNILKNMLYDMFSYIFNKKNQQISGVCDYHQSVGINILQNYDYILIYSWMNHENGHYSWMNHENGHYSWMNHENGH